jgi:hypothetical protein
MANRLATGLLFVGSLAGLACGGDSITEELAGVYQVTHHTLNQQGCDSEGPTVDQYSHFALAGEEFLVTEYLEFQTCTSADPATCQGLGVLSGYFLSNGQWIQQMASAAESGSACVLAYTLGTLTALGNGGLEIEVRRYREVDGALTGATCSAEEATLRGSTMPCIEYERVAGQRL